MDSTDLMGIEQALDRQSQATADIAEALDDIANAMSVIAAAMAKQAGIKLDE